MRNSRHGDDVMAFLKIEVEHSFSSLEFVVEPEENGI